MATVYGKNRTLLNNIPSEKIPPGEASGGIQVAYDEYTFLADVMAVNDLIDMKLSVPAGAIILDAYVLCPSTGTTGQFALGTSADADALIDVADSGGQAVKKQAILGAADLGKKLTVATDYQLKCVEATDDAVPASGSNKIQAYILYVHAQA